MDHVRFFKDWSSNESFTIPKHKVSLLIPEHFHERYLRVYVKNPTEERMVAAQHRSTAHRCPIAGRGTGGSGALPAGVAHRQPHGSDLFLVCG